MTQAKKKRAEVEGSSLHQNKDSYDEKKWSRFVGLENITLKKKGQKAVNALLKHFSSWQEYRGGDVCVNVVCSFYRNNDDAEWANKTKWLT